MKPHVYRVFIRAPREAVWEAITDPAFTRRYFHATAFTTDLVPGARYRFVRDDGTDAVVGELEVVEPPERLVLSWRILYDAVAAEEPPSRVEWTLTDAGNGMTRVDVVHGDLGLSPVTWASVRHGWVWILDSLKSLLETGAPLPAEEDGAEGGDDEASGAPEAPSPDATVAAWHRDQAIEANNSVWALLGDPARSADDDEQLLRSAYASAYHWARAHGAGPEHEVRASYLIAKAHLAVGDVDVALRAARRCVDDCAAHRLDDFDLAYAHEVLARSLHASGQVDAARRAWEAARAVDIADDEDRALVEQDLADGLV